MKTPLAERVAIALLLEMASGNYEAGMRFFSNRQIMKHWRVSCPIASQAQRLLLTWKVLRRRERSGYYLLPEFRQRALALVNKNPSMPLPQQPHLQNKIYSLRKDIAGKRIAVVLVLDENLRSAKYKNIPQGIACAATTTTARIIFDEARQKGVTVDFYLDDGEEATHHRILSLIMGSSSLVGAILVRRIFSSGVASIASKLLQKGIPVVAAFDDCERTKMVSLNFNNFGIGYAAVQALVGKGHRHIGVGLCSRAEYFMDRLEGACLAAKESKIAKISPLFLSNSGRLLKMSQNKLLQRDNESRITALFAVDVSSLCALHHLTRLGGLKIPKDVSVIVCSSTPLVPKFPKPVDIMRLDFETMGRSAFRALERLISGGDFENYTLINTEYQKNGSVRSLGVKRRKILA